MHRVVIDTNVFISALRSKRGDEFILELAVHSQSEHIITYNKGDFAGVEDFGIVLLTPKEFLQLLGEIES